MKTHAQAIQFSGYPLNIAASDSPAQEKEPSRKKLAVVRKVTPIRVIRSVEDWVNNPSNWDERWFCSYE